MNEITIKCFDSCVYQLKFPDFFRNSKLTSCYSIFRYLFIFKEQDGNFETIAFLDDNLPKLCDESKQLWHDCSITYQRDFQSLDRACFPSALFYKDQIQKETECRKRVNERLRRQLLKAKRQYEHDVKLLDKYNEYKNKYAKMR